MKYTITTAKGSHTANNLRSVCAWQAKMQASFATIEAVTSEGQAVAADVDDVDFDAEKLSPAIATVEARLGLAVDNDRLRALQTEARVAGDAEVVEACERVLEADGMGLSVPTVSAARAIWRALDAADANA